MANRANGSSPPRAGLRTARGPARARAPSDIADANARAGLPNRSRTHARPFGAKITDVPRVSGRKGPCGGPLATFGGRLPSSRIPGRGPGLRAKGDIGDFCTERRSLSVKPPLTLREQARCHPERAEHSTARRTVEPPSTRSGRREAPRSGDGGSRAAAAVAFSVGTTRDPSTPAAHAASAQDDNLAPAQDDNLAGAQDDNLTERTSMLV